jgi:hypothetical protein
MASSSKQRISWLGGRFCPAVLKTSCGMCSTCAVCLIVSMACGIASVSLASQSGFCSWRSGLAGVLASPTTLFLRPLAQSQYATALHSLHNAMLGLLAIYADNVSVFTASSLHSLVLTQQARSIVLSAGPVRRRGGLPVWQGWCHGQRGPWRAGGQAAGRSPSRSRERPRGQHGGGV